MSTIVNEKMISFKELEQNIFNYVCEQAREITQTVLENLDEKLRCSRNKSELRCKGKRKTTIKTVYGEVEYKRNIYEGKDTDGHKAWIYLLDQELSMDKIGMISTNLAEKIAATITEVSYRITSETVSGTCGQSISHGGVWNLVQKLGERISKEEDSIVSFMNANQSKGEEVVPVLFQEMDGVWLRIQGKDHKKAPKQEMKVSVMYEGWKSDGKQNSRLHNKILLAGMDKSQKFHEKREAQLRNKFNADEIKLRVLNGDGASWIKDPYEVDTIIQLDRFHIYQDIKRKIRDKGIQKELVKLFKEEKIDEMLDYILMYADSVDNEDLTDQTSFKARSLYDYLNNNKSSLLPYQSRGINIPVPRKGIVYKNMGVQENQNCTTITMRMKGRRMRWSTHGANHMAKLLYKKENRDLYDAIERYTDSLIPSIDVQDIYTELSVAKTPKRDGKGNSYIDLINHKIPMFDGILTASRKAFKRALL